MKLAKIENDKVVNIAEFDDSQIPDWASDWVDATNLDIDMVDDGNGNFAYPPEPDITPEQIQEAKNNSYNSIDTIAERTRLRFITGGAGQSMTYQLKGSEADAYAAAGYPADLTDYPFIQAESTATGASPTDAANNIIAQRDAWLVVGVNIEEIRISGKVSVTNATTMEEINLAVTTAKNLFDAM